MPESIGLYRRRPRNFRHVVTLTTVLAAAICFLATVVPGHAQDSVAAFYRGKTLRVINPFAETGGYAFLAQLFANFLPRYLPGNPTGRPEFMPGGGGLQGANYMYNAAPRDGTVISLLYDNMPTAQALALDTLTKFDARKFGILGSINRGETGLIGVLKRANIPSIAIAREKVATLGATGTAAAQYLVPFAANKMLGTTFRLIPGYKTVADTFLAMDNGEVDGLFTNYVTILEARPNWIAENRLDWLAQSSDHRDPQFADVPLLQELTDDPRKRDAFRFLAMSRVPGKILITTPGVPADRLAALQSAFAQVLRDPQVVAALDKLHQGIEPRTAAEALDVIRQTVETDPATLASVRTLMRVAN